MENNDYSDWDLYAVVRNATAAGKSPSIVGPTAPTAMAEGQWISEPNPFDELTVAYKPLLRLSVDEVVAGVNGGAASSGQRHSGVEQPQELCHQQQPPAVAVPQLWPVSYWGFSRCSHRRNRKREQRRETRRVTEEELATDKWAWRKYGQKPIKGSSFPRHYYRCSSSKGCSARKQVERCTTNPNLFIVTYSGNHHHPHPLPFHHPARYSPSPSPATTTASLNMLLATNTEEDSKEHHGAIDKEIIGDGFDENWMEEFDDLMEFDEDFMMSLEEMWIDK